MAYDEHFAGRIRALVAGEPDVTEQRMFGGLAFLVGGNMSVAASGQGGLMVRVDPEDTNAFLAKPHVRPFEMRGRPMHQAPARDLGFARRYVRALAPGEALVGLDGYASGSTSDALFPIRRAARKPSSFVARWTSIGAATCPVRWRSRWNAKPARAVIPTARAIPRPEVLFSMKRPTATLALAS